MNTEARIGAKMLEDPSLRMLECCLALGSTPRNCWWAQEGWNPQAGDRLSPAATSSGHVLLAEPAAALADHGRAGDPRRRPRGGRVRPRSPAEFLRSLAHVSNSVLMVLICLNVRIGRGEEVGRSFALFCLLASAVALVIIVQAISFNLWRDFRLAGLLGEFAPAGPGGEIYAPSPAAALPRANGLYSEPSVAGWFMTFATALALAARRLRPALGTLTAAACSFGAMATLSLTGILGPTLVWTSYLLLVRDRWRFKAISGLIAGLGMAAALHQAHELGILSRFDHLNTPGTSIYFRLSAPYRLIGESLERYPFGYPLGQTDFIATRHYYINWDQGSQTNVDNTLLMIVFYFGLLGILCNAAYLLKAAQFLVLKRHAVGLIMLSLLIAASTTGAGWAHHFVLMIGYAIVVGRWLYERRPLQLPQPTVGGALAAHSAALRRVSGTRSKASSSLSRCFATPRCRSLT
jgi:hypothetical protein